MLNETISGYLAKGQIEDRFLIKDIATYGCSGGVSGLTYYTETIAFYDKHKKEIWDMLYDLSEDQGFSIPFLISDFCGVRNVSDEDTFKNLLVWWAVEQKARELEKKLMTRKYGSSMTNILALHSEWLEANGYISISYLTKHKRRATTYKRNCQNKKHKRRHKLLDARS